MRYYYSSELCYSLITKTSPWINTVNEHLNENLRCVINRVNYIENKLSLIKPLKADRKSENLEEIIEDPVEREGNTKEKVGLFIDG